MNNFKYSVNLCKYILNALNYQQFYSSIKQLQSVQQISQSDRLMKTQNQHSFNDYIPAQQMAKNTKVLARKQLQKRIQGLKQQQYIKISNNLQSQNTKLKNQVKELNEKVEQLLMSKKVLKVDKNPQIEQQIIKTKKQLQLKYESMNYLKDQIKRLSKKQINENRAIQIQQQQNMINHSQRQLAKLQKQKKKLTEMIQLNQISTKQYNEEGLNEQVQMLIQNARRQNKSLKQQIHQLNLQMKTHEKTSKATINKYYDLKKQSRQIRSVFQTRTSQRKLSNNLNLNDIKNNTNNDINHLQQEVEDLKKKKKQAQKQLVNDKIIKQTKKNKFEKQIRESLQYHKELFKRRTKALNQLNLYEKRDRQYKDYHEKQYAKQNIQTVEFSIQTQKIFNRQFRKDQIGNQYGLTFNDGKNVQYKSQALIRSVTVYKTNDQLVFVKFHYEIPGRKKYETEPPFDINFLKKCQSKKITTRNNGYLKNIKASLADNKIVKIDLMWSDNQTSTIGWDSEISIKYKFDIQENQRPICMFGSVSVQGKNNYVLNSIGCEISDLEQ